MLRQLKIMKQFCGQAINLCLWTLSLFNSKVINQGSLGKILFSLVPIHGNIFKVANTSPTLAKYSR